MPVQFGSLRPEHPVLPAVREVGQAHTPSLNFVADDIVYDDLHCLLKVMDKLLAILLRQFDSTDGERVARLQPPEALRTVTNLSTLTVSTAKGESRFIISLLTIRDEEGKERCYLGNQARAANSNENMTSSSLCL